MFDFWHVYASFSSHCFLCHFFWNTNEKKEEMNGFNIVFILHKKRYNIRYNLPKEIINAKKNPQNKYGRFQIILIYTHTMSTLAPNIRHRFYTINNNFTPLVIILSSWTNRTTLSHTIYLSLFLFFSIFIFHSKINSN